MNKTIQDLKREVDTIKKTQSEATLEIETLGKKSGTPSGPLEHRGPRFKNISHDDGRGNQEGL